jgi:hypothetical protein
MKEKFDNRLMRGKIKISCKQDKKVVAVWEARKEDIIDAIIGITNRELQDGLNISLRGLFYKLVSQNLILNYLECYQKLSNLVDDCKYGGILDWNAIKVDDARNQRIDYCVENIPDALEDTVLQYKLNRQEGQPLYIEVWCEKETLVDVLRRITDKYHIPLCIVKGRDSSTAIYNGYQRFREELAQEREVRLIYIGDFDPSGKDMIRDIEDRIRFMLDNSTVDYSKHYCNQISTLEYKSKLPKAFKVDSIALTMNQIEKYRLPTNYAKESDRLYNWYIEKFKTKDCWEVDALDRKILTEILEEAIINLMDLDMYKKILQKEIDDKQFLEDFISTLL